MPLRHLITLIIDTHPSAEEMFIPRCSHDMNWGSIPLVLDLEKTSLLHKPSMHDVSVVREHAG
jgi:hypothetical protein